VPQAGRITFGPFTGGINRAVAKDKLGPSDLYEAIGVFQGERGSLNGCFESPSNVVSFTDSAVTATGQKKIPLRVIYWAEDGKLWQLYSKDYAGATSIRREGTDREYGSYAATGVINQGFLILCGNGQQALAVHSDYSANTSSAAIAAGGASYSTSSGVVTVSTWSTGNAQRIIVGDYLVDGAGNRFAITTLSSTSTTTFTIATGQTVSFSSASYIERFRPIRLGSGAGYSEEGTVSVSQGSKTVTMSSTAGIAVNQYITFSNNTTFTRGNLHPRSYKIAAVTSGTVITLEDAYEGTTDSDASCRVATTALKVALPFIYGGRLCAVGADADASNGSGDYNVIYWSGYPGDTDTDSDIFDFMWWDQENANYPVGVAEGAIQRVIPQDRRMVPFLQNGVYAVRGTLPVDAALGHDLGDSRIDTDGIGLTTYDAACVGPDGQTIFFGAPDGMFKLYGNTIEPIDQKIVDHELYSKGMQWAAIYDGRIYFTDATEHPENVQFRRQSGSDISIYSNLRNQTPVIWILDIQSMSFTCTQRVESTVTALRRIGCPGFEGGLFAPYRGDLSASELLLVGTPGGCVSLNERAKQLLMTRENIDDASTFHGVTVITPSASVQAPMAKPRKIDVYANSNDAVFSTTSQVFVSAIGDLDSSNAIYRMPAPKQVYGPRIDYGTRRFSAYFPGQRGLRRIGAGVGSMADSFSQAHVTLGVQASSRSVTGTASVYYASKFTATDPADTNFSSINRLDVLLKVTATNNSSITVALFDSNGTVLASSTGAVGFYGVQDDYYWLPVYLSSAYTLVLGNEYYIGVQVPSGVTVSFATATFAPQGLYTITGGVIASVTSDEELIFRCVNELGKPSLLLNIDKIELEYLPLPGRKR
jgi:hypothetical protein